MQDSLCKFFWTSIIVSFSTLILITSNGAIVSSIATECVSAISGCAECLNADTCRSCEASLYIVEDGSRCLESCEEYRLSLAGDVVGNICEDEGGVINLLNWHWTLIGVGSLLLLIMLLIISVALLRIKRKRRRIGALKPKVADDEKKVLGDEDIELQDSVPLPATNRPQTASDEQETIFNGRYSKADIDSILKYKKNKFVQRIEKLKPEKGILLIVLNIVKKAPDAEEGEDEDGKRQTKESIVLDLTVLLLILNDSLSQIKLSTGYSILKWGEQVLTEYHDHLEKGASEEELVISARQMESEDSKRSSAVPDEADAGEQQQEQDMDSRMAVEGDPIVILQTSSAVGDDTNSLPRYSTVVSGEQQQRVERLLLNAAGEGAGAEEDGTHVSPMLNESSTDAEPPATTRGVTFDDHDRRDGMGAGTEEVYIPREDYVEPAAGPAKVVTGPGGQAARITSVHVTVAPPDGDLAEDATTGNTQRTGGADTSVTMPSDQHDNTSLHEQPADTEEAMVWYF